MAQRVMGLIVEPKKCRCICVAFLLRRCHNAILLSVALTVGRHSCHLRLLNTSTTAVLLPIRHQLTPLSTLQSCRLRVPSLQQLNPENILMRVMKIVIAIQTQTMNSQNCSRSMAEKWRHLPRCLLALVMARPPRKNVWHEQHGKKKRRKQTNYEPSVLVQKAGPFLHVEILACFQQHRSRILKSRVVPGQATTVVQSSFLCYSRHVGHLQLWEMQYDSLHVENLKKRFPIVIRIKMHWSYSQSYQFWC